MKKNIFIISAILVLSFTISGSVSASNQELASAKQEILKTSSGHQVVTRVDTVVSKIVQKVQSDSAYGQKVQVKVEEILKKYWQKSDKKSRNITIIFTYLDLKLQWELNVDSRIVERLKKVSSKKSKNRATSRLNKLKQKKYQRIHVKK